MKTPAPAQHSLGAHIVESVLIHRFQRLAMMAGVALCISGSILAQDEVAPLEQFDLDPSAVSSDKTDARFTNELLRDAERYATGKGYAYKPTRAYELYKKAAETGNPRAVYEVARCLILGEGVMQNEKNGLSILKDLAKILVQSKDFNHVRGFNPILKKSFKTVKDLRPGAIAVSNFETKDGSAIVDPNVLSINESSLRMMHSTGITTFKWDELPAYVQDAIGYDKVSAYFEQAILAALTPQKP